MNANTFDLVTRSLAVATDRRRLLQRMTGAGIGLGSVALPALVVAKKRRKKGRKARPPKPNAFGCLNVGDACRGDDACCSGVCGGRKGKRRCEAHHAGICGPESGFCRTGVAALCHLSGARCWQTTGKAGFCGLLGGEVEHCRACTRDVDCEYEFGPGAACIVLQEGICAGTCANTGGTACVPAVLEGKDLLA